MMMAANRIRTGMVLAGRGQVTRAVGITSKGRPRDWQPEGVALTYLDARGFHGQLIAGNRVMLEVESDRDAA